MAELKIKAGIGLPSNTVPVSDGTLYFGYNNDATPEEGKVYDGELYFDQNGRRHKVGSDVKSTTAAPGAGSTDATVPTSKAVYQAIVNNMSAAVEAMVFKGAVNSFTDIPTTHTVGWTYKVATAGLYAGQVCEVGDTLICVASGSVENDNDWIVLQGNIDGAVTGPASATDAHVATFSGATGKVIADSGFTIGKSVPSDAKFTDTTYSAATTSADGLMTSAMVNKLNGIAAGAQVNTITGVKGSAESTYRTGQVSLSAANVGALASDTKYAGASTAGGSATSAVKLDSSAGSLTQPIYFNNGKPAATTYALNKTVPSDAVFTDTVTRVKLGSSGTFASGDIIVTPSAIGALANTAKGSASQPIYINSSGVATVCNTIPTITKKTNGSDIVATDSTSVVTPKAVYEFVTSLLEWGTF